MANDALDVKQLSRDLGGDQMGDLRGDQMGDLRGDLRGGLGKNPMRSRDHNRRVILDLLRQKSGLQRKDLAAAVQLSAPAIANILEDLLSEGLILDMGRAAPPKGGQRRGQPPLHFALNPSGAHTLGFEIGPKGIVCVMLDLIGQPLSREILSTQAPSFAQGLAIMRDKIGQAAQMKAGPLLGLGLVRPGSFSPLGQGGDDPTALKDWDDVSADQISQILGHPVWLENDANAAALAEALFGAGAQLRNLAVLYFGEGLGLGALVDGKLLRGSRGMAGEIGHILVVPDGLLCSCGQRGCLERYVSRHALAQALGAPLAHGTVSDLWAKQDDRLLGWIEASAKHLSYIAHLVENLFDPESIVLSGQLPAPVLEALIEKITLRPSVTPHKTHKVPRLQQGYAGVYTAALGAAALPYYDAMSPQDTLS